MYRDIAKLVLYRDLGEDSILMKLSGIFEDFDRGDYIKDDLVARIYDQIKRLLDVATDYGFDKNLWHNYLAFILITNENSFSITSEKVGANNGTVNYFAKNDFKIFKKLFDFDFSKIEEALGIDCFSIINNYKAIGKKERMYNKNVSVKVQDVSNAIEQADNEEDVFRIVTDFYKAYGVGMFGLNKAFRITHEVNKGLEFVPINNTEDVRLDDLIGYEIQKQKIVENTEAFVAGRKANNALLFGDSGTGKSTTIKAIINEYYDQGLRMIEIYKHQFQDLSQVISQIKNRNYKFIIYMDDLSFEEFEIEYKYLKAVIEGGLEIKPDNVLIYATSNRRHLIRETWNDRSDMENGSGMHRSDTMQEKLSLVNRFGVTINYSKPSQKEYFQIVTGLAHKYGIQMSDEELCAEANKWELAHGGISGRTAQQFIYHVLGNVEGTTSADEQ
jgi:predicted AAA+ superfamily ATPase